MALTLFDAQADELRKSLDATIRRSGIDEMIREKFRPTALKVVREVLPRVEPLPDEFRIIRSHRCRR